MTRALLFAAQKVCRRDGHAGEAPHQLAALRPHLRQLTGEGPCVHVFETESHAAAHLRQLQQGHPDVATGIAQAGTHEAMGLFTSEAEVEERLRALATAGELRKLAALWVKGFAIEWERIVPRAEAALVTAGVLQ